MYQPSPITSHGVASVFTHAALTLPSCIPASITYVIHPQFHQATQRLYTCRPHTLPSCGPAFPHTPSHHAAHTSSATLAPTLPAQMTRHSRMRMAWTLSLFTFISYESYDLLLVPTRTNFHTLVLKLPRLPCVRPPELHPKAGDLSSRCSLPHILCSNDLMQDVRISQSFLPAVASTRRTPHAVPAGTGDASVNAMKRVINSGGATSVAPAASPSSAAETASHAVKSG